MPERRHEKWDGTVLEDALLIAPGLAHRMRAVIAPEADRPAPPLDHHIKRGDRERCTRAPRDKDRRARPRIRVSGEPEIERRDNGLIKRDRAILPGLGLLQLQTVAGPEMRHLSDGQGEDFAGAISRVDAEAEEAQIARPIGQKQFDTLDRFHIADRLDLDGRTFSGVIGIHWRTTRSSSSHCKHRHRNSVQLPQSEGAGRQKRQCSYLSVCI